MWNIEHDTLRSIDSDKIDHSHGTIIGVTFCEYCKQIKSTFRAPSGKVYCNKLHQELDEK